MTSKHRLCLLLLAAVVCARPETGVIIPSGESAPKESELSIESMDVSISIENQHATVWLREVFHNHTPAVMEGIYSLGLAPEAAVSDFAVWDDLTRIPGVILERKRASELYDQIRAEQIDPGLLESAEVTESNAPGQARRSTEFSVKIVPIPALGYKRIEAAYRQTLPVAESVANFVFPLKASTTEPVSAGRLSIHVDVRNALPITAFDIPENRYGLPWKRVDEHHFTADITQMNVTLRNDLQLRYTLGSQAGLRVTAYRSGDASEPGYFEASALLGSNGDVKAAATHKCVIALFDTSLSMQWEKLERSFAALESVLRSLSPGDNFNVIVFNTEVTSFAQQPQAASPENVARALEFVRGSKLRGGTDLVKALSAAFGQSQPDAFDVLLTDGEITAGVVSIAKAEAEIQRQWQAVPAGRRPRVYSLAIGDDANRGFLQRLSAYGGVYQQINSTEPIEYKLGTFVHEIGLSSLAPVDLDISKSAGAQYVYRLTGTNFTGALASWVGEYANPAPAEFTAHLGPTQQAISVNLPAHDTAHDYLPATWARARVDALLEKIDRDGEDKASIDEIIRLSRKYHFVTPYTSFLAAPRALLRPRLIRPGDPVLRVRTDSTICSVVAIFPFELIKPLRYLQHEDMWQTRFLAPDDLADGSYTVRLILRDRAGHVYQENKTFLISSHAPVVRAVLASCRVHAGSAVTLKVQASATTRSITATLYGAPALSLRWNENDHANSGVLMVPASLSPGRYAVHVSAEDIAHNVSHQEVPLEVLP